MGTINTPIDLFTEASRDVAEEEADRMVSQARIAVAPVWPFLAGAESPADFDNRRALVADRIDRACSAVAGDDLNAYTALRGQVEAQLVEDFDLLYTTRQAAKRAEEERKQAEAQEVVPDLSGRFPGLSEAQRKQAVDRATWQRDFDKYAEAIAAAGAVVDSPDGTQSVDTTKVPAEVLSGYRRLVQMGYANGYLANKRQAPASRVAAKQYEVWSYTEGDDDWKHVDTFDDRSKAVSASTKLNQAGTKAQVREVEEFSKGSAKAAPERAAPPKRPAQATRKLAWSMDQVRKVVQDKQYATVDGMILDLFTASAIVAVYDALSPENKAKVEGLPLERMAEFALKHTGAKGPSGFWCRACGQYQSTRTPAEVAKAKAHTKAHQDKGEQPRDGRSWTGAQKQAAYWAVAEGFESGPWATYEEAREAADDHGDQFGSGADVVQGDENGPKQASKTPPNKPEANWLRQGLSKHLKVVRESQDEQPEKE